MTSRDDSPVTDEFAVDWSTAPDWAEFHAFDGPEYAVELHRGGGGWYGQFPQTNIALKGFRSTSLFRRSGYTVLSPNWRYSIRQRPEKKMETPEWLYPGAECETRSGGRARIYAIDGGDPYPLHGAVIDKHGLWEVKIWTPGGEYRAAANSNLDLIGPWRPWKSQIPPAEYFADWVKWVAMSERGDWVAHQRDPAPSSGAAAGGGYWVSRGRLEPISRAIRMPTVPADQWRTTKIRIRED